MHFALADREGKTFEDFLVLDTCVQVLDFEKIFCHGIKLSFIKLYREDSQAFGRPLPLMRESL